MAWWRHWSLAAELLRLLQIQRQSQQLLGSLRAQIWPAAALRTHAPAAANAALGECVAQQQLCA